MELKFSSICLHALDSSSCLISQIFFATYSTYIGSFSLPLYGTGVRYGESVSVIILSIGHALMHSGACLAFLKVIGHAKEIIEFIFKHSIIVSLLPLKQWKMIFVFAYCFKMSMQSFVDSRI